MGCGPPPGEKISDIKWLILTGMTPKYGMYFYFLCQQEWYPPCCAEWGVVRTRPGVDPAF